MIEINNLTRADLPLKKIQKTANVFLAQYAPKKTLSIAFIGDKRMRDLNCRCRGCDKTTDVLSFAGDSGSLGEILLNFRQIERQARKYSASSEEELIFILVHGLLHLLGYTDETEQKRQEMIALGRDFILKNKLHV